MLPPLTFDASTLRQERKVERIRHVKTMQAPMITLGNSNAYHMFISYHWNIGQENTARDIKHSLQNVLPGSIIFLECAYSSTRLELVHHRVTASESHAVPVTAPCSAPGAPQCRRFGQP